MKLPGPEPAHSPWAKSGSQGKVSWDQHTGNSHLGSGCTKADRQGAAWGVSMKFARKLSIRDLEHPGKPAVAPIEPTGSSPPWFQGGCLQEGAALMDRNPWKVTLWGAKGCC